MATAVYQATQRRLFLSTSAKKRFLTYAGTRADTSSSLAYTFRQAPPNKQTLLRTLSPASPSHSLSLLDWGTEPTDLESLGLSGLDEFVSGVKWPEASSLAARQLLVKRRRSIEEHTGPLVEPSLAKRPRLSPRVLASLERTDASISTPTPGPSLPIPASLRPKGTTTQHGSVRLRLGLQKRLTTSSRPAPDQSSYESYDVSVHVRMTPRRKLGAGPPRVLATETPERTSSESPVLAFGLQLPAVTSPNRGDRLHLQFPVKFATPGPSSSAQSPRVLLRGQPTPDTSAPRGVVLVPASPSPIIARISDVPAASLQDGGSWIDSRVSASVLYDSSEGSQSLPSQDTNNSRLFLPPPLSRTPRNLETNRARTNDSERQILTTPNVTNDNPTPDVLVSASLSLSLQETGSEAVSATNGRIHESSSERARWF